MTLVYAYQSADERLVDMLLGLGLIVGAVVIAWIIPVLWGVKIAKAKGYSPAWMFMSIYPLFGWITLIILACLSARKQCANCGGFVASHFKLCPHCHELVNGGDKGSHLVQSAMN